MTGPSADGALVSQVAELLRAAEARATTDEAAGTLRAAQERLAGPLRVAIAGKIKAGKSTLLNALLGEELAATDAGECTRIVSWYAHGDQPHVLVHPRDGDAVGASFRRSGGALEIDLEGRTPEEIDRIEVFWPTGRLRDLTFVDTPGIASLSEDVSARTLRLLTPEDDRAPAVDAIVYLLRHMHSSDVRFLESFHDDELAKGTPLNAVGVLSRADEIGSCQLDAMQTADRVASRYQGDPRIRRLCQVIVPVNGLLGYAAGTLREVEYRALATIAAGPVGRGRVAAVDRRPVRPVADQDRPDRTRACPPARPIRAVRGAALRRPAAARDGAQRIRTGRRTGPPQRSEPSASGARATVRRPRPGPQGQVSPGRRQGGGGIRRMQ